MTIEPHPKSYDDDDDDIEVFLAKEWNSFHLSWKKLEDLHLKVLLKYKWEWYLKQGISPSLYMIDYAIFSPLMQCRTRHILCRNIPCITPLEIHFHHYLRMYFKRASIFFGYFFGNFFFHSTHQVDLGLYLMGHTAPTTLRN